MRPSPARRRLGLIGLALATALLALSLAGPDAHARGCKKKNAEPGEVSTSKAERSVHCLLNRQRRKRDVPKLERHRDLNRPAAKHSKLMVRENCFQHVCPGETSLRERLAAYLAKGGRGFGENIAYGGGSSATPRSIVRSWMRSEGHRRNILNPNFEHIGIGIVWGSPNVSMRGPAGTFTTDFGYRDG